MDLELDLTKIDTNILNKVFKSFVDSLHTHFKDKDFLNHRCPIEIHYLYNNFKYVGKIKNKGLIDNGIEKNLIQVKIYNNNYYLKKTDVLKTDLDINLFTSIDSIIELPSIIDFTKECLSDKYIIEKFKFYRKFIFKEQSSNNSLIFEASSLESILRIKFEPGYPTDIDLVSYWSHDE